MSASSDLIVELVQATEEVFETMVFKKLTTGAPIEGDALRATSNVVGLVGFGGALSGLVAFYSTRHAAEEIAAAMLGLPAGRSNGEMPDAIGEVTNMIAGGFRLEAGRARRDAGHLDPVGDGGIGFLHAVFLGRPPGDVPVQDGRPGDLRRADSDSEMTLRGPRLWMH